DRAEAIGDLDAALELAHQLWRAEPGHPAAFRVLANVHRTSGDLAALTELTSVRASRADSPDDRAQAWLEVARPADEVGALPPAADRRHRGRGHPARARAARPPAARAHDRSARRAPDRARRLGRRDALPLPARPARALARRARRTPVPPRRGRARAPRRHRSR